MTTRDRLLFLSIALIMSTMVAVGIIDYKIDGAALLATYGDKLAQTRFNRSEVLKKDFENIGNSLLIASNLIRTRQALKDYPKIEKDLQERISKSAHPREWEEHLMRAYDTTGDSDLGKVIRHLPDLPLYLQSQFSKKARLGDVPIKTVISPDLPRNARYTKFHEIIHPLYLEYADQFGISDIFLVNSSGTIIYTLQKGLGFATNLNSGIFKGSSLAGAYNWSLNATPRSFRFFDFAPTSSFLKTPAAYFTSPVFEGSHFLGAIIFQISLDRIDNLLSDSHQWKKMGLMESGEVLAIGHDGILRNNSRVFFENPAKFLRQMGVLGNDSGQILNIENAKTTALNLQLPAEKIQRYFQSEDLIEEGADYIGQNSLASIGKVHLPGGGEWLLLAKISSAEMKSPISSYLWLLGLATIIFLTAFTLIFMFLSKRLVLPLESFEKALEQLKQHNWPLQLRYDPKDEYAKVFSNLQHVAADLQKKTESMDLLENLIQSLKELLFLVDIEPGTTPDKVRWTIKNANAAAGNAIGIPLASLLNSDLKLWLEADFEKIHMQISSDSQAEGNLEGALKMLSGNKIPLALSVARLGSSKQSPYSFVLIASDTSKQKEIEKALKVQEGLLKDSQAMSKTGSFLWDISSGTSVWSEELFEILGLDHATVRPSADVFRALILPEDLNLLSSAYLEAQKKLQPLKIDMRIRRALSHELIWVRMMGRIEYDAYGNPVTFSGIIQDVTDLKHTEMDLIATKDEALKSSQAKSEFLAHMSHEIRTPMNAIMGMAELLRETKLSDEQEYYVTIFCKAGEVLMALINDILDLSKIEAGEVSIENIPFDMNKVMTDIRDMMRPRALEKGLEYSFEIGKGINPHLMGDPTKLRQVLINLVGNSIKFTERGQVRVSVRKNPTKKDSLMISVSDSGVGIPASKQHLIFQKFSQADTSITRRYGGTGLGLAISKSLVELMGGQIWFKSREGVGTTFFLTIPLREQIYNVSTMKPVTMKTPELDFVTPKVPHDPNRKIRILLADDTEDNRVLFRHYLKGGPYEIVEAENGLQALDKIKSNEFDIVFMDVQMPEMDGYAATGQVREWERNVKHPHIPIIALTAHALSDDKEKSLKAGCDDHITKPFKKDTLLSAMSRYLQ